MRPAGVEPTTFGSVGQRFAMRLSAGCRFVAKLGFALTSGFETRVTAQPATPSPGEFPMHHFFVYSFDYSGFRN
jgi:hypothetical protein